MFFAMFQYPVLLQPSRVMLKSYLNKGVLCNFDDKLSTASSARSLSSLGSQHYLPIVTTFEYKKGFLLLLTQAGSPAL